MFVCVFMLFYVFKGAVPVMTTRGCSKQQVYFNDSDMKTNQVHPHVGPGDPVLVLVTRSRSWSRVLRRGGRPPVSEAGDAFRGLWFYQNSSCFLCQQENMT